ncbi:MAG: alcohol dehydrogenase [Desulfobulbaceae bacterium A2]|nr:MAG: alcohol dehydrogenase [Desulfobulbaceae bacterium A2]
MRAVVIQHLGRMDGVAAPLVLRRLPRPRPGPGEVLLRVTLCGVCHTELDEIEGRSPPSRLPMIPGHQVVGTVIGHGRDVPAGTPALGTRVGVAWIGGACGACQYCRQGRENLCPHFQATGRDRHGGYAEYMTADARFVSPLPSRLSDEAAAPLLCAGAVGLRALHLAGDLTGRRLGFTGFGGSAHLVLAFARVLYGDIAICVFARSPEQRAFALRLGVDWAGDTDEVPPAPLDAIIDTTPAWRPVLAALNALAPGGRLVINAIRKRDDDRHLLSGLDYARHLWQEKELHTVANVTRADVAEALALAAAHDLRPQVTRYPLAAAARALCELRAGRVLGSKVLDCA